MSTMMGKSRRAFLTGFIGTVCSAALLGTALADVASDKPGAVIIYPKIVVDTAGLLGPPTDTILQLTNTSNQVVSARCFLVDRTSRCSLSQRACTPETASEICSPGETCTACGPARDTNFRMTLTKRQPIAWRASQGLSDFPCDVGNPNAGNCPFGQSNTNQDDGSPSNIVPAKDDPFLGELRCVQVRTDNFEPTAGANQANGFAGDLAGEATVVTGAGAALDARKYNAITLAAKFRCADGSLCSSAADCGGGACSSANDGDDQLILGGADGEYDGCPNVLTLNHFFDDSLLVTHSNSISHTVTSDLTVSPCASNYETDDYGAATLQFLVFNEFEQRLSASKRVECWEETQLSDLDSRPGPFGNAQSIFNVGVQGTYAGQTRVRPVGSETSANGVLAVAEEFLVPCAAGPGRCSSAFNVHYSGTRDTPDLFTLSSDLSGPQ